MRPQHDPAQRRTDSDMFPIIKRYLESNQTQSDFCQQENLPQHVFLYWLRKYRRQHQTTSLSATHRQAFLPIHITGKPAASATACEILLPTGIVVRFDQRPHPEELARLVAAVTTGA